MQGTNPSSENCRLDRNMPPYLGNCAARRLLRGVMKSGRPRQLPEGESTRTGSVFVECLGVGDFLCLQ